MSGRTIIAQQITIDSYSFIINRLNRDGADMYMQYAKIQLLDHKCAIGLHVSKHPWPAIIFASFYN